MKTKIQQLIKIVEESNIDELEISTFWGGQKIRVIKNRVNNNVQPVIMQQPVVQSINHSQEDMNLQNQSVSKAESSGSNTKAIKEVEHENEILSGEEFTAPLVGTFYQSAKPGSPPFVKEGDTITKGQIICIIEAMKIFNEIESEHNGIVKKILVQDGNPVEFGQALMVISTH
jgi:acetyl-CoA carboxylase biotin carboxyl carrier protein